MLEEKLDLLLKELKRLRPLLTSTNETWINVEPEIKLTINGETTTETVVLDIPVELAAEQVMDYDEVYDILNGVEARLRDIRVMLESGDLIEVDVIKGLVRGLAAAGRVSTGPDETASPNTSSAPSPSSTTEVLVAAEEPASNSGQFQPPAEPKPV